MDESNIKNTILWELKRLCPDLEKHLAEGISHAVAKAINQNNQEVINRIDELRRKINC